MIDYQVRLINFPHGKAKEAVTENEDGSFTIFIDESLSKDEQKKEFLHAMSHIIGLDFEKYDIQKIEQFTHDIECSEVLVKRMQQEFKDVGIA